MVKGASRIAIVDENTRFRRRLIRIFRSQADFQIVGVAANTAEALNVAELQQPDVMVIELGLPGGVAPVLRAVGVSSPRTRCIVTSAMADKDTIDAALDAGAVSHFERDIHLRPLLEAVRALEEENSA